jgi:hypothetical protein
LAGGCEATWYKTWKANNCPMETANKVSLPRSNH